MDYAGHSFRIGAANTAVAMGLEDTMIQAMGRWRSDVYLSYIRLNRQKLARVSGALAHCQI